MSLVASLLPFFLALKRRAAVFFMRICRRMKFSDNARKFFIFSVIVVLLLVQATDYASSLSAQSIHSMLWADGAAQVNRHEWNFMIDGTMIHSSCSYHVPVVLYFALIILTVVLLSSYKMTDAVLLSLKSNALFCWWGFTAVILVFVGYGQYMVVSECMLVVMMASNVYPPKDSHTDLQHK